MFSKFFATPLTSRIGIATRHLIISAVLAMGIAILVFFLWFPQPYSNISGGKDLFFLICIVDVIAGPLLTLIVFDVSKSHRHLMLDLSVIGAFQLIAFAYGTHTIYLARPVALVFEVDRFRVITAADVYAPELDLAPPEFRKLPLKGIYQIATRSTRTVDENNQAIFMGAAGIDMAQRPLFWVPYTDMRNRAVSRSKPATILLEKHSAGRQELMAALSASGLDVSNARFLPLVARKDWVVFLDKKGTIKGFAPFNGFF